MFMLDRSPPPYEDIEPPAYDDSFNIQRKTNERYSEEIKCILADKEGTYTLGDLILGNINICPVSDTPVDEIVVDFVLVESCIINPGRVLPRTVKKISIAHHKVPTDQLTDGQLKSGFEYTFPFSILIPYALPLSSCRGETHSDLHSMLPAPIGAPYNSPVDRKQFGDLPDIPARLTYGLRVRLSRDSEKIKDSFKTVPFMPTYPLDDYLTHYNENIYSTTTKYFKNGTFRCTNSGQLTLESPHPVIIGMSDERNLVDVPLSLKFQPSKKLRVASSQLPVIRKLSYQIVSRLTVTPARNHFSLPPRPQTEVVSQQSFDTKKIDWTCSNNKDGIYTTNVTVPVSLSENQRARLTPTFATCLVAREYEVIVYLQVGTKANPKNVQISVPMILMANSPLQQRSRSNSLDSITMVDSNSSSDTISQKLPTTNTLMAQ